MKKNYMKPDIVFEDFSMSTSIATGCEVQIDNQSKGSCGYQITATITYFTETVTGCVGQSGRPIEDGTIQNNSVCYHNPSDLNNLFNS